MRRNRINDGAAFSVFCYAVMIIFSVLCLLPLLNIFAVSLSGAFTDVGLLPVGFTLYSYGVALREEGFYTSLAISVAISIIGTALSVTVMLLAAYPLSKKELPFRKGIMVFFIITMLFSGGVIPTFIWYKILGIIDDPIVLVLPVIVQTYNLILIKTYFEGLPSSIEEAAELDGAGVYRVLFQVLLPMCVPIVITVCLFTVVGIWNNYQNALYYLPTKTRYYPLSMYILNFVNGSAIDDSYGDPEKAYHKKNIEAAIIILSIIPIVCTYPFFLKYFTGGVAVGAVKE